MNSVIACTIVWISLWCTSFAALPSGRAKVLREAIANADRVEVQKVTFDDAEKTKPFEVRGAEKIKKLIAKLDFNDKGSGFHCMCDGDHTVKFFVGEKLVTTVSHHHGRSLRWDSNQWEGDSLFTSDAAAGWRKWFSENGVDVFARMHEHAMAEAKADRDEMDAFMREFPKGARSVFTNARTDGFFPPTRGDDAESPMKNEIAALEKLAGDPVTLGYSVCRALGALNGRSLGSWSVSSPKEQLAIAAGTSLSGDQFARVLEKCGDDKQSRLGAARLFFFDDMDSKLAKEAAEAWAAKLAETVIQSDKSGNADMALRGLSRYPTESASNFLKSIASADKDPQPSAKGDDEPGAMATACLLLARWNNKDARAVIDATRAKLDLPQDIAALDIGLGFLGEREKITAELFKFDSYTLGLNGMVALEKLGGKRSLAVLVEGALEHSWAGVKEEAVLAIERVSGQKWVKGQRADFYTDEVKKWWAENRDKLPNN